MFTIVEVEPGRWQAMCNGAAIGAVHDHYADALAVLAAALDERAALAIGDPTTPTLEAGLLPEVWSGPIARTMDTGDGRDFSACVWSWRDPAESRLPLMWQTQTQIGHFEAELAGYVTQVWDEGGEPWGEGRFFDTEAGRQFRDVLASAGRWGVSVDPGSVEWTDVCLTWDEEAGFCVDMVTQFSAYQIIGVTGTPFPAFATAYIELGARAPQAAAPAEDAPPADGAPAAVAASAPVKPPRSWFQRPADLEPTGSLNIDDNGARVWGYVTTFDQCHVGWRGQCITAPDQVASSLFHTGEVLCADGSRVATGPLIMDTDHPAIDASVSVRSALDHYAHTGFAWADVVLGVDEVGIWCAGAVRPNVTDEQVRVLRASALSGDWRTVEGTLQLVAVLTVSSPGFPIPRALAASGRAVPHEARPLAVRWAGTSAVAALGLGRSMRCRTCGDREQTDGEALSLLRRILGHVSATDRRTRLALQRDALTAAASRVRRDS